MNEYNDNEFIKLNRKIIGWEWFTDIPASHLFIYCLLSANWKEGKFQGKLIQRGEFVTSLERMSGETGLSIQQVRTAISKLEKTGEITNRSFNKYRIIRVNNYCLYQGEQQTNNKQITNNQQTNNKQITTIEEVKKIRSKEVKKELSKDNSIKNTFSLTGMIEEKEYPEQLKEKIKEWLKYKSEKKQSYKQTGFNVFLGKVDKALEQGCDLMAVIDCFDNAMSHNWSGVFFDKIQNNKKQAGFNEEEFLRRFEDE